MTDDLYFYDMDFDLLDILPKGSRTSKRGYSSVNITEELRGSGSVEILCTDAILQLVKSHKENLMIKWHDFTGLITGFEYSSEGLRLFGTLPNGLMDNHIMTTVYKRPQWPQPEKEQASRMIYDTLENRTGTEIVTIDRSVTITTEIAFPEDNYTPYAEFISNIVEPFNAGYKVTADYTNKRFVFGLVTKSENNIMLSKTMKNISKITENYINRDFYNVGYWQDENEDWHKLPTDAVLNSKNKSCVLSATNSSDAIKELASKKATDETEIITQNLKYGVDYHLGDICRIKYDDVVSRQQVTAVNISYENGYGEEPVFTEMEE